MFPAFLSLNLTISQAKDLKRAIKTMLKVKPVNKVGQEEDAFEEESGVEVYMEEALDQAGESRVDQIKFHLCALVDLIFA